MRIYSYWSCLHQPIVSSWPRVAPASRASSNTVIKASNQISSAGLACPNSWLGRWLSHLDIWTGIFSPWENCGFIWFYMVLYGFMGLHHIKPWKMVDATTDFTFFEGFNGSVGWFKGKTQQYRVFWPQHIMVDYFPSMFPATHGQRSAKIGPKSDILWHLWPSAPDSSYCWCTPWCFKGGGTNMGTWPAADLPGWGVHAGASIWWLLNM